MTPADILLAVIVFAPLVSAVAAAVASRPMGLRDLVALCGPLASVLAALALIQMGPIGVGGQLVLIEPLPGAKVAFEAGRLELVAAAMIALMGAFATLYLTGWLRLTREPRAGRLLAAAGVGLSAACGAALSADLFTLFLCGEMMVLASLPLLYWGEGGGKRAGHFLMTQLLASTALFLPAIVWTHALAGDLAFVKGGLMPEGLSPAVASTLLLMFVFGATRGVLTPFTRWMHLAHDAPAPVAALLLSATVWPVGVVGLAKITLFVFGADGLAAAQAGVAVGLVIALGGGLVAALLALPEPDLRARLTHLAAAHAGLVCAGALMGPGAGGLGATLHLVGFSLACFASLGALGVMTLASGRSRYDEGLGMGAYMPWSFGAFALAALSLAGAAPLAGAWSIIWLTAGAGSSGALWASAVVAAVSLVTFAALAPAAARAFLGPRPSSLSVRPDGSSLSMSAPVALAAGLALALVFVIDAIARYLGPVLEGPA